MAAESNEPESVTRTVRLVQPADEFWPAVVEDGVEIHSHGPGVVCDPKHCCVVASTVGLVKELDS